MPEWTVLENAKRRGKEAFRAGVSITDCPLRANRIAWETGWREEAEWNRRSNDALSRMDEFYGAWWGKFSRTEADFRGQYDGPYGQFRKRYEFC